MVWNQTSTFALPYGNGRCWKSSLSVVKAWFYRVFAQKKFWQKFGGLETDFYLRTPLQKQGKVKSSLSVVEAWFYGVFAQKKFWQKFGRIENSFYLCAPLTETKKGVENESSLLRCSGWVSGFYRRLLQNNFRKKFGGLKSFFYLCTPLRNDGNERVMKSS